MSSFWRHRRNKFQFQLSLMCTANKRARSRKTKEGRQRETERKRWEVESNKWHLLHDRNHFLLCIRLYSLLTNRPPSAVSTLQVTPQTGYAQLSACLHSVVPGRALPTALLLMFYFTLPQHCECSFRSTHTSANEK